VHDEQERGEDRQGYDVELHRSEQQQKERKEKVEEGEGGDDPFPIAGHAMQVPVNFLRNIAGINDQKLAEGNVGPEEDEGEE
jgi:hypothetical protein